MRILVAHNFYQQPGGEDAVFEAECAMLRAHGHEVHTLTDHNDRVRDLHPLSVAVTTIWSQAGYRAMRAALRRTGAEVLHVHNSFSLLSPAILHAAAAEGVPVVHTLHNFRLLCPAATLFRDGRPCHLCRETRLPWPGVRHGCFQGRRLKSAGVAAMLVTHRALGTWRRHVQRFIVMNEHARRLFIESGLPAERLVVKPHFVAPDPGPGPGDGGFGLFVGRLAPGKGLETLVRAWRDLDGWPLKIVGDGPLAGWLADVARREPSIEWLGARSREEVAELMARATFLLFPSEAYETFGLVVVEAFARGTPVIAARVGAVPDLVTDRRNGLLFEPGDAAALAACARRLAAGEGLASIRAEARRTYLAGFTEERNHELLLAVYRDAMGVRGGREGPHRAPASDASRRHPVSGAPNGGPHGR